MINKFKNRKAKFYDLKDSIGILCNWLYNTFKKKIILLIDNYDLLILDSLNTDFFDDIYSFYQNLLTNIFQKKKKKKRYIFKSFITGKIDVQFFKHFDSNNYSKANYKFNKYFSVIDLELQKLLCEFKLEDESEIFEKYCNINTSNFSSINPTNNNYTNKVNIIISFL